MQTQILKYKKIQKVITESGPSLPGLAEGAAEPPSGAESSSISAEDDMNVTDFPQF